MIRYEAEKRRWERVVAAAFAKRKAMLLAGAKFSEVQAEWRRTIPAALERWLLVMGRKDPWTGYAQLARQMRAKRLEKA